MTQYTGLNNGSGASLATNFGQVGVVGDAKTIKGADAVIAASTDKINTAADTINGLLADYNPNNPASLLQAQQALANYNLAITVTSSFIKSLEDTTKAVAQHVS